MKDKHIYIIAGANGSGKTTFAREFLPNYTKCPNFINADLIAQGLSPFSPQVVAIKAGRLVLEQISAYAGSSQDFGFETTLSGKTYLKILNQLKGKGYKIHLYYLWIPVDSLAIARIKSRVAEGGHDVPRHDIQRRFGRSIRNFFDIYIPILDSWMLFDNSGSIPRLIAEEKNRKLTIIDHKLYDIIRNVREANL